MKILKLTLPILFMFLACNKKQNSEKDIVTADAMEILPPMAMADIKNNVIEKAKKEEINNSQPLKVIYTANIKYQILDLDASETKIRQLVKKMGGYVSNSSQIKENSQKRIELNIRIPVAHFDDFLKGTETESIFTDFKNINSEDVSEEFYDNEIRIKSKKVAFEKYISLLKMAKNVKEILEVEQQIRVIQEEIEAKEGRQKFLNNQVAFSTVNLNLYQVLATENAPDLPFYIKIWQEFKAGANFFIGICIGLFYWIPFILTLIAIYFGIRFWRKKNI